MADLTNNETQKLKSLYQLCKERAAAYHRCSQNVDSEDLKTVFAKYEEQSLKFIEEYIVLYPRLANEEGETPTPEIGGFKINDDIMHEIDDGAPEKVLKAVREGEISILNTYNNILDEHMSSRLAELTSKHLLEINDAYDNISGILKKHFQ
jgi:hypothetical protein